MADVKHVQHLRGSSAQNDSYTGLEGELTVDLTNNRLRVHDGLVTGGVPLAKLADLSSYLPLSGGTLTGTIANSQSDFNIRKTIDTGRTILRGSTDYSKGASLYLTGKDYSGSVPAGAWELIAHDGTNSKSLRGAASGDLTWAGDYFSFAASGIISAASGGNAVSLWAGSNNFDGCSLQLYGRSHSSYPGRFYLRASTKSSSGSAGDSCDLSGRPTGELLWGSKKLAFGAGTYTLTSLYAFGYITSSATQLTIILPIQVVGTITSANLTALTASVRVGPGAYTSPGGGTPESLIPAEVTKSITIGEGQVYIALTRSTGWGTGATNNAPVVATISSITFTVT